MGDLKQNAMPSIDLATLNRLPEAEFARVLGSVFAHAPWVAAGAAPSRPFASVEAVWEALCAVVRDAPRSQQLGLIRAQPELEHSISASWPALTPEDAARFARSRADYQARFGFPLVICAPLHDQAAVLATLPERLQNDAFDERIAALAEIYQIARVQLGELVAEC